MKPLLRLSPLFCCVLNLSNHIHSCEDRLLQSSSWFGPRIAIDPKLNYFFQSISISIPPCQTGFSTVRENPKIPAWPQNRQPSNDMISTRGEDGSTADSQKDLASRVQPVYRTLRCTFPLSLSFYPTQSCSMPHLYRMHQDKQIYNYNVNASSLGFILKI